MLSSLLRYASDAGPGVAPGWLHGTLTLLVSAAPSAPIMVIGEWQAVVVVVAAVVVVVRVGELVLPLPPPAPIEMTMIVFDVVEGDADDAELLVETPFVVVAGAVELEL